MLGGISPVLFAPSLNELRRTLREKPAALIGILFAPPYTKIASETIVPRIGYLDARSAHYMHFFCAGFFGYGHPKDEQRICTTVYPDTTKIPWSFDERQFAAFVEELEHVTSWKYSGECDLILVEPKFKFSGNEPEIAYSQAILFNIDAMLRDGAIESAAQLFEAVMRFARERESATLEGLRDRQGLRLLGETAAETIVDLLPRPARKVWKRGLHYRVQNLDR